MTGPRSTRILTRDGTRLAVTEYGPRDAAHTVIAAHGLCLSKGSWALHADNLTHDRDDVRVIAYDHRGHGDSGHAHIDTYTVDQLAADLADVIAWAQVTGTLTLAGHSMGGMTAMAYLGLPEQSRPKDPDSLLLVATAAGNLVSCGLGALLELPVLNLLRGNVHRMPERLADPLMRRLTGPVVTAMVRHIGYTENRRGIAASASAWSINATPIRTKVGFLNSLATFDARAALASITAQTVVFSGGRDFLTPHSHAEDIVAAVRGARHCHYPTNGHMLLDEVAAAVTDVLSGFVGLRAAPVTALAG